jgi:hypothetical protein
VVTLSSGEVFHTTNRAIANIMLQKEQVNSPKWRLVVANPDGTLGELDE